ncbi:MAG TPA: sugar phosphate isomerase/epimerase family protein [Vicinamibacterales bacterium]|jgi:L-ribulose-5-phosphate 3-epimerase|nr:sugar phosphate isomerase/epimerase family protein [Vicinamibacterales bacterium]
MISRRTVLAGLGAAAVARGAWLRAAPASLRLSILTDEISQDFGHACEVASRDFGMGLVDLREAGGKNLMNWDAAQIADVRKVVDRFNLRVACLATPIFKVDWPEAPKSQFSPKRDEFGASFTFAQQDELLERAFELAKQFQTDRIRVFDFWRLEDQKPHRAAIDDVVRKAAAKAGKRGLILVLENEYACNTATGAEAGRLAAAIPDKALQITWDPGNAQFRDEVPFPGGYAAIPKGRIGHMHCKDAAKRADGKWEWMAMGSGVIDWAGQFRALKADGYSHACTLETHWRGAGTPEASSRESFAGMKSLLHKAGAA